MPQSAGLLGLSYARKYGDGTISFASIAQPESALAVSCSIGQIKDVINYFLLVSEMVTQAPSEYQVESPEWGLALVEQQRRGCL